MIETGSINLENSNYLIVIKSIQVVNVAASTLGDPSIKLIAICLDAKVLGQLRER